MSRESIGVTTNREIPVHREKELRNPEKDLDKHAFFDFSLANFWTFFFAPSAASHGAQSRDKQKH